MAASWSPGTRSARTAAATARIRRDDGTRQDTGFFTISNAPHVLEFDWRGATGPGTLDAAFTMWIDDAIVSQLFAMDNDAAGGVDFARLGTMVVKAGASGTALFDQFESRRERKIGPEWP